VFIWVGQSKERSVRQQGNQNNKVKLLLVTVTLARIIKHKF